MDLTVPYTFYPMALPHWIAWALFLAALAGATAMGAAKVWYSGWKAGLLTGVIHLVLFLVVTVVASMIITFFVHDL